MTPAPPAAPSAAVVIPTWNARDLVERVLASLAAQTRAARVIVVDNGSEDGTTEMVAERFPGVHVVALPENLGFGRAVNRGADVAEADVLVLVNNDVVCAPDFVERILEPFADPRIGMVAGVLTQERAPERIDSAGIVLDTTLGSSDHLADLPVTVLDRDPPDPVGPCGGAAAYRMAAFRAAGGFDPAFFAYWEDVDLALRLHRAGWRCVLAPAARAEHRHGATLGAASPRQRRLEAFGRAYVLARHGVVARRPWSAPAVVARDWPGIAVHLIVRREAGPLRERLRGAAAGRARRLPGPTPTHLAARSVAGTLAAQGRFLARRVTGRLPAHYGDRGPRRTVAPDAADRDSGQPPSPSAAR